ncbi:hypothetical protein [Bacillus cereus group sp. BfR-BA-01380]|uniref:hypothetical protein n=1 Tax=Bacillus cereus group sp. BfR-BA-01380 TaxID=2920324 RepID=UPI001F56EF04|nr:hypothetical protein [Bacillus cereus group sp. BfR-BA-01380]
MSDYCEVPTEEDLEKALKLGITKRMVYARINQSGWSLKRAISELGKPVKNQEIRKMIIIAQKNGISEGTFRLRLKKGWLPEDAATIKPNRFKELKILAESNGISENTFLTRINRGMGEFEAATKPLDKRGQKKKQIN